jgi:hypothetical protein
MNRIVKVFINRLAPRPSPPLGRWRLDYCSKTIEHKVNLTNEDHCGPCSYYRLTKVSSINESNDTDYKNNDNTDDEYKYLCM